MKPTLPQFDSDAAGRRQQIEANRDAYQWDHDFLEPLALLREKGTQHPDDWQAALGWEFGILPKDVHPPLRYLIDRPLSLHTLRKNTDATKEVWDQRAFTGIDDYRKLFVDCPAPSAMQPWPADAWFAFQRVGGANPVVLQRVAGVPAKLALDPSRVVGLLPGKATLGDLAGAGRLYLCDYAALQGIPLGAFGNAEKFTAAPIGLFYVGETGELRPLAIQFGQEPIPTQVFTPNDSAWLIAKTYLQIADINHHEMGTHLCRTHFILETFAVAASRQLSARHPVAVLLQPHLRILIWNNFEGRELLLSSNGLATRLLAGGLSGSVEILRRSFAGYGEVPAWTFDTWDLPLEIQARGTHDSSILAGYPYRDDGLLVWSALRDFVAGYLRLYYPGDAEVAADPEVQGWASELASADGGRIRGIAAPKTIADLTSILTRVIFACGPQHAAVNFPQYDFAAFAPNMPAAAYARPPQDAGSMNAASLDAFLLQMLPPPAQAELQIKTVTELTSYRFDRLGYYQEDDFSDAGALALIADFQKALGGVQSTIEARNQTRAAPYPWFLPQRITNSTSI